MTAILELVNLRKRFGGQTVTDELNLCVGRGEVRCLIGPNGAGKSTALQLVAGLLTPNSGQIVLAGQDVTDLDVYKRFRSGMGIKFQIPSIFDDLTVGQNLRIACRWAGGRAASAERVEELLDLTGLVASANARAETLSHGQKQWLEIGMAVADEPLLLLLDEPTAGMSPAETEKTGDLILKLGMKGTTVLAVEHDMHFVKQIATRVTVLDRGRVFFEGSVDEVLSNDGVAEIYLGKPQ